jgi:hypothetical protein
MSTREELIKARLGMLALANAPLIPISARGRLSRNF